MSVAISQAYGITLLAFDASWLHAWSRPIGHGRVMPSHASEALATGAAAVVDGPMFAMCDSPAGSTEAQKYAASQCAQSNFGVFDASGIDLPSFRPDEGITIGSYGDAAFAVDGFVKPDGAVVAVQLYPPLVRNGANIASDVGSNATAEWRAGVALLGNGQVAFAAGAMSMTAFANALIESGATDAGYTDGGGSTRLAHGGSFVGAAENRRVATWIVARPPTNTPAALVGLGLVGGLGVGLYRWLTGSWPWG